MRLNIKELMFWLILAADIKTEGAKSKKWEIMKKKKRNQNRPSPTRALSMCHALSGPGSTSAKPATRALSPRSTCAKRGVLR